MDFSDAAPQTRFDGAVLISRHHPCIHGHAEKCAFFVGVATDAGFELSSRVFIGYREPVRGSDWCRGYDWRPQCLDFHDECGGCWAHYDEPKHVGESHQRTEHQ